VEVFDASPGGDLIGHVSVDLRPAFESGNIDKWFTVHNNCGTGSGDIHVTIRFTATSGASKSLSYAPNPYTQPPNPYGAAPVQQYAAGPGHPPAAYGGDTLAAARAFLRALPMSFAAF
jgi:hypothetical protein